jgi:hypothetical protein
MTTYHFQMTLTKRYLFGLIKRKRTVELSKAFDSLAEARADITRIFIEAGVDPSTIEYIGRTES